MMRRVRILRIIARLNVGGPARHVVWLTEALNNAEFETILVTGMVPPGEDDMSTFANEHGVTPTIVHEMSREISPRDVVAVWKIFRLMRRFRPDVVHTHTAKAGFAGRLATLLYNATVPRARRAFTVHTFHGHIFHGYYGRAKTALFLAIERVLARTATDRILVLSEQQWTEIHRVFRVGRAGQFRIVPLGLDLEAIRGGTRQLRADLGIRDDEFVVAIVGRLTAIKNHEMFLRAASMLDDQFGRFVIFGEGNDRVALERLAGDLGIAGRVIFAGTREARDIYASADVVALTSKNEGTPLTLIEAMANGLPIVSTAVGGVVDLLGAVESSSDGYDIRERGLTVASGDAAAFGRALHRVRDDAPLRGRQGAAAQERVEESYSKERLIADIIALYRELVDASSTTDLRENRV